jgi:hypothetical protein
LVKLARPRVVMSMSEDDDYCLYPEALPSPADYEEMDVPVRKLVAALNELPSVRTISSCGGHETPVSLDSLPPEGWYVTIVLEPTVFDADVHVPSPQAWLDLEFLAYLVNSPPLRDRDVDIVAYAKPPHLNFPGRMLTFNVQGWREGESGVEPDEVASAIEEGLRDIYVE